MGAICYHGNQSSDLIKPSEAFPHPNDASHKISFKSANWLQRYLYLIILTDGHTDGRTDARTPARQVYYKLTHEILAQMS